MAAIHDDPSPPPRRTKKSRAGRKRRKAPKPPNKVDPGWIHRVLASASLRVAQQAAGRKDVFVEVGSTDYEPPVIELSEEGAQPSDLLARVIAHIFYRIPGLRRVEKRMEGEDKSSGFLSDLGALIVLLGKRNEPLIREAIQVLLEEKLFAPKRKDRNSEANPDHSVVGGNGNRRSSPGGEAGAGHSGFPPVGNQEQQER